MVVNETIKLRLILTEEDSLYHPFSEIKKSLGITSNSQVLRFIIKKISEIPIDTLILDFKDKDLDSIEKVKSTEKEVKKP